LLNRLREKEETVTQVLSSLAEESTKGTPILVEGKKDVETLRALGISGPIVAIKTGGKSFIDIVSGLEDAKIQKAILLLDFDRRGKQGTNRLRRNLEGTGIKVELAFWLALLGTIGKDVQCIEGLNAYMKTLRTRTVAHTDRKSQ
jgi:2,5-diamino-6-(ribosylamino)-4(3H)-pyrimidinone 5'-phosphate reductase